MDEAWERAVEAALGGQADSSSSSSAPPRTLTLDGSVKCLHGRLPPPEILERYQSLEHLSIANVGVSSLEKFPRLRNLQRLILSDNRIAGGLEFLVEAGLDSLRDLDLSNNRIQFLEDLAPLAHLRLVSLDLYECPVTRTKDYRSRVFGMIRTLKYLDKMDADENERPESDEEEEEEEDDDEEDEEEDPGSGEVDGDDQAGRLVNGVGSGARGGGIVDVDEEDESDAEEEDAETVRRADSNASLQRYHLANGFRVAPVGVSSLDGEEDEDEEEDVEDDDDEEEDNDEDLGEEIDAEDGDEEDVVEVHDVGDSDEDIDGVEEDGEEEVDEEEEDDEDGSGEEDQEDVEDEEDDGVPGSSGRLINAEGEIDGHEQGEGDEDENGEIGEEDEQGVDDDRFSEEGDGEDDDEDDDIGGEYLVQPIAQPPTVRRDFDACNDEEEDEVDDEEDDPHRNTTLPHQPSSSQPNKRKRDEEDDIDNQNLRSSKHP
ncbi:unnamed protein product [Musa acuminata subsp. burmannicoides]